MGRGVHAGKEPGGCWIPSPSHVVGTGHATEVETRREMWGGEAVLGHAA